MSDMNKFKKINNSFHEITTLEYETIRFESKIGALITKGYGALSWRKGSRVSFSVAVPSRVLDKIFISCILNEMWRVPR